MLGLQRDTYLPPAPVEEYWNLSIFSLWSFNRYPRKIVIIHPEECKGLRLDSPIVAGRRHKISFRFFDGLCRTHLRKS